jgi:hypothetical protein
MQHPIKAIIMDASTNEYREFQFNPVPVDQDININYTDVKAPGLPHPFFQYTGGEADNISFNIELDDSYTGSKSTNSFLNFMQRFRPAKDGTQFAPPPQVIIAYGMNFYTGLVSGMKITTDQFDPQTLIPTKAVIAITIRTLPVIGVNEGAFKTINGKYNPSGGS